jgi:hypothetical protein
VPYEVGGTRGSEVHARNRLRWLGALLVLAALVLWVSPAYATDGLPPGEPIPAWAEHKFVHFMPHPAASGASPQLAGGHGERLHYWGGPVQTEPQLYLLFWGSNFTNGTEPKGLYTELHYFYSSLSGEFQFPYTEGWQGILTQYTNVAGHYKDAKIIAESHINNIGAPKNLTDASSEAEVSEWIRELKKNGTPPNSADAQFIVLTPPGATYSELPGCGYHSAVSYESVQYSYTVVPYSGSIADCNYLAGSEKVKEKEAQLMFTTTGVASHEFAESVTDPGLYDDLAWTAEKTNSETEIADLCADEPEAIQELPEKEGRLGWTYVFMLWDDEGGNKCKVEDPVYPTPPAPSVATEAATNLGYHEATLNGTVNPGGPEAHYHFEWGLNSATEHSTAEGSAGYGESISHESAAISGLKPGTTYHFRVSASNWVGGATSSESSFTTSIPPPTVTNEANSNIGDTSGTVNGEVNPNGFSTTYQVQYWPTGKPKEVTDLPVTPATIGSGEANVKVSQTAIDLTPFSEYRWHIVATNGGGTTYGPEASLSVGPFLARESTLSIPGEKISLEAVACPSATDCEAVGGYQPEKDYFSDNPYAQKWAGKQWAQQTVPKPTGEDPTLTAIGCSSTKACTAIGSTGDVEASEVPFAERWNGAAWAVETMPVPEKSSKNHFAGITCNSETSCWAAGSDEISSSGWLPFVEHWNGTEWGIEHIPALPDTTGQLEGISCTSTTECQAVGWQYTGGTGSAPIVAKWHEGTWIIGSPAIPYGAPKASLLFK